MTKKKSTTKELKTKIKELKEELKTADKQYSDLESKSIDIMDKLRKIQNHLTDFPGITRPKELVGANRGDLSSLLEDPTVVPSMRICIRAFHFRSEAATNQIIDVEDWINDLKKLVTS